MDNGYFARKHRRERARAQVLDLTAATVSASAADATEIGSFNVRNGVGTYTFSLTDDAGATFDLDGAILRKADTLTAGLVTIVAKADNGVDDPITQAFQIRVTA